MKKNWSVFSGTFLVVLLLVSFFNGCINENKENNKSQNEKILAPMDINLSLSENPELNMPVNLKVTVKVSDDAPNTIIETYFSEGIMVIKGDTLWEGDILKNHSTTLDISLKFTKAGFSVIKASAKSRDPSYTFGKSDALYILLSETSGEILEEPPMNEWTCNNITTPLSKNNENIDSRLEIDGKLNMNSDFYLNYSINTSVALSDIDIYIVLPREGLDVIEIENPSMDCVSIESKNIGVFKWKCNYLSISQTTDFRIKLKPTKNGECFFYAFLEGKNQNSEEVVDVIAFRYACYLCHRSAPVSRAAKLSAEQPLGSQYVGKLVVLGTFRRLDPRVERSRRRLRARESGTGLAGIDHEARVALRELCGQIVQ